MTLFAIIAVLGMLPSIRSLFNNRVADDVRYITVQHEYDYGYDVMVGVERAEVLDSREVSDTPPDFLL